MNTWQRRSVIYTGVLALSMYAFAVVYQYGMATFEGDPKTFLEAFQFVVETFTTTGYGAQAGWDATAMLVLIIVMDITGTVMIFLALPVVAFPAFEEALSTTVPTAIENGHEDHVVVATYTPRVETLIGELDSRDVDWVIVEPDRDRATDLYEEGYDVIHNDPDSADGLTAANLSDARALVADVSDQVDASIVLTAKEIDEAVRVVSVVEEPDRARYHDLAGADAVLSPRPLLGESLARKVTASVSTDLGSKVEVGEDFDIVELPVHRGADVAGRTLAESGLREQASVNVIGAWFDGEFESPPQPDSVIEPGTVLLMTGNEDQLKRLADRTRSEVRRHTSGETIVVGHGEVGQTVTDILEDVDLPYTVVDQADGPGVDVVGDATDPEVLEAAGLRDARSVILAIPDDTAAEFATLVVRDESRRVEIIARAEEAEAVQKMYRAGADYVLALGTVTGRMVASEVLGDEDVISLDTQVEVVRTCAPRLVGTSLGDADVRARTGVTVVAVERNGDVVTDLGPDFRTQTGDELIVAGPDESTNRFTEVFG
ncbi:trk active potasium channel [Halosimplex carlsbadense 2-9-1]|uniref:Trk active potasium channel n=1 Tax=Halosimplex carlsbadense 2-9-1 TaxID=797114 RepID=M0CXP4_9EURY|nr:NAD-binding protein [Halosimplex carlsbadense]ELZ27403.1 trk active potasium channel [Halosimplex carlsbadense 2-9-1]